MFKLFDVNDSNPACRNLFNLLRYYFPVCTFNYENYTTKVSESCNVNLNTNLYVMMI